MYVLQLLSLCINSNNFGVLEKQVRQITYPINQLILIEIIESEFTFILILFNNIIVAQCRTTLKQ